MAKWGEGDLRWIVEERPDAVNVNNWHWTEKNAAPWSKERLTQLLCGVDIEKGPVKISLTEFKKLQGEATANNRKAKLIFVYEWEIELKFEARVSGSDTEYKGYLEIPNLSDENTADEIDVNTTLESKGPHEAEIRHILAHEGTTKIREQLAVYIRELKEEFSKGAHFISFPTVVADKRSFQNEIHHLSADPSAAWEYMQQRENRQAVSIPPLLPISTNILPDHARFVCISDTHNKLHEILHKIPPGDVLIHAGDFTGNGDLKDVNKFNEQLGQLPHKNKIVIAGNHELTFNSNHNNNRLSGSVDEHLAKAKLKQASDLLTNCTYLEDEAVSIYGINIYGSPWQPEYGGWAFNLKRGHNLMEKWARIPANTDVLITHGPPVGHGDLTKHGVRSGCVDLLNVIEQRVQPKFNVFGHIHEGYGLTTNNRGTVFINASTCNSKYHAVNDPIIFDLPLPRGVSKV